MVQMNDNLHRHSYEKNLNSSLLLEKVISNLIMFQYDSISNQRIKKSNRSPSF